MRYAEQHRKVAEVLALRSLGVTARELASRCHISERLAKKILNDMVAEEEEFTTMLRLRKHKAPGPRTTAVITNGS